MQIKFRCLVEVENVSKRYKDDGTEYVVVKVCFNARGKFVKANLMCFDRKVYSDLKEGVWYNFEGAVVVQSGNTYLVIEKTEAAFDLPY